MHHQLQKLCQNFNVESKPRVTTNTLPPIFPDKGLLPKNLSLEGKNSDPGGKPCPIPPSQEKTTIPNNIPIYPPSLNSQVKNPISKGTTSATKNLNPGVNSCPNLHFLGKESIPICIPTESLDYPKHPPTPISQSTNPYDPASKSLSLLGLGQTSTPIIKNPEKQTLMKGGSHAQIWYRKESKDLTTKTLPIITGTTSYKIRQASQETNKDIAHAKVRTRE